MVPPEDGRTRFLIDSMAAYVIEDGCEFEHVSPQRPQSPALSPMPSSSAALLDLASAASRDLEAWLRV